MLIASYIIHFTVVRYLISINIFKYPAVTSITGLYKHIEIFKLMSDLVKQPVSQRWCFLYVRIVTPFDTSVDKWYIIICHYLFYLYECTGNACNPHHNIPE